MEKTFSHLIRSYRQRHDMTLAEMARKCNTTAQYLHSVEGGGEPSIARADHILRHLGLSLTIGDVEQEDIEAQLERRRSPRKVSAEGQP